MTTDSTDLGLKTAKQTDSESTAICTKESGTKADAKVAKVSLGMKSGAQKKKCPKPGSEVRVSQSDLQTFSYVCRMISFGSGPCFGTSSGVSPSPCFDFEEPKVELARSLGDVDLGTVGIQHESMNTEVEIFHDCLEDSDVECFRDCLSFEGCAVGGTVDEPTVLHTYVDPKDVEELLMMYRGFPNVNLDTDDDDSDYAPSFANSEGAARGRRDPEGDAAEDQDQDQEDPFHEIPAPFGPEDHEGHEGSFLEVEVPELLGDLLFDHESRGLGLMTRVVTAVFRLEVGPQLVEEGRWIQMDLQLIWLEKSCTLLDAIGRFWFC